MRASAWLSNSRPLSVWTVSKLRLKWHRTNAWKFLMVGSTADLCHRGKVQVKWL